MKWIIALLFVASVSSVPSGRLYDESKTQAPVSPPPPTTTTTSNLVSEAPRYVKPSTEKSTTPPSPPPEMKPTVPSHHPLFNVPQFPFLGYRSAFAPMAGCPPCPCAYKQQQHPHPQNPTGALYPGKTEGPKGGKEDHANDEGKDHPEAEKKDEAGTSSNAASRQRRGAPDYWHDLGRPSSGLLANNMGLMAVQSIQDQLDMYGPPLHMGKISSSDFNYPNDFHLFNTPGRKQELLMQAGFYMLTGPLTVYVDPVGDLVGPLSDMPDTFTSLILSEGVFRMSTVQKNNIFKIQDPNTGVVFIVNCLRQSGFSSCNNLKKMQ